MYARVVKRLLDIILSCVALAVMALPMLMIALAIKIDSPGPVLFQQKRFGQSKNGQTTFFSLWKFRSMKVEAPHEVPTHLLVHPEAYITRVGRFLRRTSLDELPQLLQVLTGRMSLVGPRPALWNQEDLIAERERYGANDIKPGLTGWAQVNGRDELAIAEKARLDGIYATTLRAGRGRGLVMDVQCCLRTVGSVLRADGIVEGDSGAKREKSHSDDSTVNSVSIQNSKRRETRRMATDRSSRSIILNIRYWKDLLRRWWRRLLVLLIVPVVGTVAIVYLYDMTYTPRYETTATLYVLPSATGVPTTDVAMPDDLTMSEQFLADCVYLFGAPATADRALELAQVDITTDALIQQTTVSNPVGTHLIVITVKDSDTERAQKLIQALSEAGMEATEQLMGYQPILVHEACRTETLPYNRFQPGHYMLTWLVLLLLCIIILWIPYVISEYPTNSDGESDKQA